jgi:anti-sigma regulatory factor (Ser/Thr protein kinase)
VRDEGRWRPPRGSHRGRGLPLMRALMETVDVEHGDAGTVVVLERTLGSRSAA